MDVSVSIIIPTYNEASCLPELLRRIDDAMKRAGLSYECVVVDDDSPDGTFRAAEALAALYPLRVHRRTEERCLSSAMLYGLKRARGTVIGCIDSDLQHPPELIPLLVSSITEEGCRMAIGSRLVEGGKVEDWAWYRRLVSWCGRILALPLTRVKDTMSGFFFISPEVIDGVSLNTIGYKLGLEIIVKGNHGKNIKEVPYTFQHRHLGASKMSWKTHNAYLWQLMLLYAYKIRGLRAPCFFRLNRH